MIDSPYDVIFASTENVDSARRRVRQLKRDIFAWQQLALQLFENEARATERVMEAQKLLTRCSLWLPETI